MSVKAVLVTGSNRGIGLEMVRQLSAGHPALGLPRHIFACCREPTKAVELKRISDGAEAGSKVRVMQLDVTDDKQVEEAVQLVDSVVGNDGLNLVVNNAAMLQMEGSRYPTVRRTNLMRHLDVNVASPVVVAQAFLPLLRRAASRSDVEGHSVFRASIVNVSSGAGSIGTCRKENMRLGVGYCVSKAALNMVTKSFAVDMSNENILFISMSPGWVRTDMGGADATSSVEESVSEMFNSFARLNDQHNGGLFRRDLTPVPF